MDTRLTPHPTYTALACEPEVRAEACRTLLRESLSDDNLAAIRSRLQQQRAWGQNDFHVMVEVQTHRFAGVRPAHKPPRDGSNGCK